MKDTLNDDTFFGPFILTPLGGELDTPEPAEDALTAMSRSVPLSSPTVVLAGYKVGSVPRRREPFAQPAQVRRARAAAGRIYPPVARATVSVAHRTAKTTWRLTRVLLTATVFLAILGFITSIALARLPENRGLPWRIAALPYINKPLAQAQLAFHAGDTASAIALVNKAVLQDTTVAISLLWQSRIAQAAQDTALAHQAALAASRYDRDWQTDIAIARILTSLGSRQESADVALRAFIRGASAPYLPEIAYAETVAGRPTQAARVFAYAASNNRNP